MKRLPTLMLAALLLSPAGLLAAEAEREREPAPVEPAGEPVELSGWFTDEWCGAGNANAKGADCVRHCVAKGATLVFFSAGKLYRLDDAKGLLEHVGREVRVKGRLTRDGKLRIESVRPREEPRGSVTARGGR